MNATIYLDRNRAHWIVTGKQAKPNFTYLTWICKIWFFLYEEPVSNKNGVKYGYPESD